MNEDEKIAALGEQVGNLRFQEKDLQTVESIDRKNDQSRCSQGGERQLIIERDEREVTLDKHQKPAESLNLDLFMHCSCQD